MKKGGTPFAKRGIAFRKLSSIAQPRDPDVVAARRPSPVAFVFARRWTTFRQVWWDHEHGLFASPFGITETRCRLASEAPKMKATLGLTGLTVNAMALIAPGAFLWLTFAEQSAYGAPMAGSAMWFGILAAMVLCFATAVSYAELSKLYPGAGSPTSSPSRRSSPRRNRSSSPASTSSWSAGPATSIIGSILA